ncbi:aminotransferase class V-fold PLP-dependent enzyme [Streptobacillus canis]|uniref:aminotransferase class V-fold PLP-dependent enzyme n=1 Tax=Streptobacillus canis TaxID=2678686 RepID=UPI0012E22E2D|nr:aminotransferase class V-fold PLP-dependent enzyme [Streptobacillus canis]
METYPLLSISLDEAIEKQFKLVELITENISGIDFLSLGDLGVEKTNNMPVRTRTVEKILAKFFGAEDAFLVRGSGTNALRLSFFELLENEDKILVHEGPIYKTSEVNLKAMKLNILKYDFNDLTNLESFIKENGVKVVLLQHTRQSLHDSYNLETVVKKIKEIDNNIGIIIDDNYAVLKTKKNGVEMGADISAFSCFKLLGPVGVGLIIGKEKFIKNMRKNNYSGGSQVQGFEAMEVLRGLVYAPVSLAIQAREIEKLNTLLKDKERFPYIKNVYIANAQSKVLLVEFKENIAKKIIEKTIEFGALSHPVGAESKFEISPLIYRVSGTFLQNDPTLAERMIRINSNRAGAQTIARIIEKAYIERGE